MSDIWLFNNDCIKIMQEMVDKGLKVDAIISDPPYELENHGGTKSAMAKRAAKVRDEIDFIAKGFDYDKCFDLMLKLCKTPNILLFCSNKQISKIMSYFEEKKLSVQLLVWNKTNPSPLCNGKYIQDIEFIVFIRGKNAPFNNAAPTSIKYRVKKYPFVSPKQRVHPTQKPLKLTEELVELHSFEGQTILDPFMGSGSTGDACKELNRNFIGIELSKEYFDKATERLSQGDANVQTSASN